MRARVRLSLVLRVLAIVVSESVTMDYNLPGSSVHVIFQARILEWVAISSSRGSPQPRIEPMSLLSPALAGRFFTTVPPGKPEYSFFFNLFLI